MKCAVFMSVFLLHLVASVSLAQHHHGGGEGKGAPILNRGTEDSRPHSQYHPPETEEGCYGSKSNINISSPEERYMVVCFFNRKNSGNYKIIEGRFNFGQIQITGCHYPQTISRAVSATNLSIEIEAFYPVAGRSDLLVEFTSNSGADWVKFVDAPSYLSFFYKKLPENVAAPYNISAQVLQAAQSVAGCQN